MPLVNGRKGYVSVTDEEYARYGEYAAQPEKMPVGHSVSAQAFAAAIEPVTSPLVPSAITPEMYEAAIRPVSASRSEPGGGGAATSSNAGGPRATGSAAFVAATHEALAALGPKARARVNAHLTEIVEDTNQYDHASAYQRGSRMAATRSAWNAGPVTYAASIAHEAAHAANPGYGQEAEIIASNAEADALREMRHWFSAASVERQGAKTKHHVGWLEELKKYTLKI